MESIADLEKAGLRISGAAQLKEAARLLQRIGKEGDFPEDERTRHLVANTMTDASDFVDVAQFLRLFRNRVKGGVRSATSGSLSVTEPIGQSVLDL